MAHLISLTIFSPGLFVVFLIVHFSAGTMSNRHAPRGQQIFNTSRVQSYFLSRHCAGADVDDAAVGAQITALAAFFHQRQKICRVCNVL